MGTLRSPSRSTQGDDSVKQLSTLESRCRRTKRVTLKKMSGSRGFKICSCSFFHPYILGEDEPNFDVRIFFSDGLVKNHQPDMLHPGKFTWVPIDSFVWAIYSVDPSKMLWSQVLEFWVCPDYPPENYYGTQKWRFGSGDFLFQLGDF